MAKEYIVVSSGVNKETGEPYARCGELVRMKDGGSFISNKNQIYLDEIRHAGEVIQVEQAVVTATSK